MDLLVCRIMGGWQLTALPTVEFIMYVWCCCGLCAVHMKHQVSLSLRNEHKENNCLIWHKVKWAKCNLIVTKIQRQLKSAVATKRRRRRLSAGGGNKNSMKAKMRKRAHALWLHDLWQQVWQSKRPITPPEEPRSIPKTSAAPWFRIMLNLLNNKFREPSDTSFPNTESTLIYAVDKQIRDWSLYFDWQKS